MTETSMSLMFVLWSWLDNDQNDYACDVVSMILVEQWQNRVCCLWLCYYGYWNMTETVVPLMCLKYVDWSTTETTILVMLAL